MKTQTENESTQRTIPPTKKRKNQKKTLARFVITAPQGKQNLDIDRELQKIFHDLNETLSCTAAPHREYLLQKITHYTKQNE